MRSVASTLLSLLFLASLAGAMAGAANASPIVSLGARITCNGAYFAGTDAFPCSNVVNGRTGDSGAPYDWSFWLSPPGRTTGSFVTIDLGQLFTIDRITLQDTHNRAFLDRGTKEFAIDVSADGALFTNLLSDAFSLSDWQNLTDRSFAVSAVAKFVRFTALGCFGCGSVGLNEISVFGATLAPPITLMNEPGILTMFGFGVLGIIAIQRRRG